MSHLNFNPGPSPGLEAKRQDSAWTVARAQEAVEQEQAGDPDPGPGRSWDQTLLVSTLET